MLTFLCHSIKLWTEYGVIDEVWNCQCKYLDIANSNILAFIIPDIEAYSSDSCRDNQKNTDSLFDRFRDHLPLSWFLKQQQLQHLLLKR